MASFVLKSGATLNVTAAEFLKAEAFKNACAVALGGVDLKPLMGLDTKDLFSDPLKASGLIQALLSASVHPQISPAFFECAFSAVYENVRVTPSLFDDPKLGERAREDYYEILWHVIEVNVLPFFKRAFSSLKPSDARTSENQK